MALSKQQRETLIKLFCDMGVNLDCSTEADLKKWMVEKVKTEAKSNITPVANHTISQP